MWGAGKTDVGNPTWAALSQGSLCSQKHPPTTLLGPAPPGNDAARMFPEMTQHPLFCSLPTLPSPWANGRELISYQSVLMPVLTRTHLNAHLSVHLQVFPSQFETVQAPLVSGSLL